MLDVSVMFFALFMYFLLTVIALSKVKESNHTEGLLSGSHFSYKTAKGCNKLVGFKVCMSGVHCALIQTAMMSCPHLG